MKNSQKGRSMVEMLGVLAIIGVLSAGAIAGYSKAMFRYKVNQTIDIFQEVLQNFSELQEKGFGDAIQLDNYNDIVKYKIMPDCQKDVDFEGNETCHLPIGMLDMGFGCRSFQCSGEFYVMFTDSRSCVSFVSAGWENSVPVDWWNPTGLLKIESGSSRTTIYDPNGVDGEVIQRVAMEDIVDGCKPCDENGWCQLAFIIRNEY